MSIPDAMMNDAIKNSDSYLTYLALSTNTKVLVKRGKGKGKGPMGKTKSDTPAPKGKKSSITAEDNIIPDPDEAFKLGKSISLTKAEEQDEQRRVHETYERLVTKKTASDEESDEEEEVPDEPKGRSTAQADDDDWGSGVEIKTLSSDDERIEPNKRKAESEKADEEIADEDIDDDEVKDNEEVADKETADEETTDDEKDNEEITDTDKDDEEMADTEKVDAEKIEEENVDEEQTGDDQANKDDQAKEDHADDNQARALIFVTQKKQLNLPPSISNLSLSSDYDNATPTISTTDPSPTVLLRLSKLEKKVEALSKLDHSEAIEESVQANVLNDVKNQLPKFLPQAVSNYVQPRILQKEKKKRRRTDTKPSTKSSTSKESSKGKTPPKASKANKSVNAEETIEEHIIEMAMDTWFNDLVNAEKDPLTFDDLMATPIDFTKFAMNRLKKDKITKANLVGHVYKLLKGTCRSCIELEYNMEQCYLALSNQLDWTTLEGDKCPYDLSKPLPLQGPLGHLTISVDFFFNNDLEYL
ncbi:hypothetical protein Tco_1147806 [Tanacetum coccineum]